MWQLFRKNNSESGTGILIQANSYKAKKVKEW